MKLWAFQNEQHRGHRMDYRVDGRSGCIDKTTYRYKKKPLTVCPIIKSGLYATEGFTFPVPLIKPVVKS